MFSNFKLIKMTSFYILFCLAFGITFYIDYMEVKVYEKLDWMDIFMMLVFALLTPIFITISIAIWCKKQIKQL